MVRYKFLLAALCLVLFGQSCIHGDLDDCPPMVNYAVAFTYTNHVWNNDRFYDDVKKINLYVFDDDNLFLTTTTELSPYETNFNIPLDLPMGKYHILAWCNVLDTEPFEITPSTFVKGQTTLNETKLTLQKTNGDLNDSNLEKLFFGEMDVEVPLYVSRIDTIPLTNDTKNIRVVLHWNYENPEEGIDYSDIVVRLIGTNAKYTFHNDNERVDVLYAPYGTSYSDSLIRIDPQIDWLQIGYGVSSFSDEYIETTVYDFKVLRLFKDLPLYLKIDFVHPSGNNEFIKKGIREVDIINVQSGGFESLFLDELRILESQWQNIFDRNDYYRVDMQIIQEGFDTFLTGSIKINDWGKIPVPGNGSSE